MTWEQVPLGRIIGRFEAGVSVRSQDRPASNGEHGVLKVSCVSPLGFRSFENKVVLPEEVSRLGPSPRRGDVLLTRANTVELVAMAVTVDRDYPTLHLSDKHWRIVLSNPEEDSLGWVKHVVNSTTVRHALVSRATGTSGSMKNVSQKEFLKIRVVRPPRGAQERIAAVLDEFDDAHSELQALIHAKRRFKRGLAQELLTGRRRFKEFEGELWKPLLMGNILQESRVSSSDGRHAKRLTVRLYGKGVIASADHRPGSERTTYYRRSAGQFIYSKLDFLNGACGAVPPHLDGFETTVDLPAFDVSEHLDVRWLVATVSQPWFYKRYLGLAHGGRKARRVNPRALLGIEVKLPARAEQAAVADLLDLLDREVETLEVLRDALDRQGRGVAELLLTGKVPVPA